MVVVVVCIHGILKKNETIGKDKNISMNTWYEEAKRMLYGEESSLKDIDEWIEQHDWYNLKVLWTLIIGQEWQVID